MQDLSETSMTRLPGLKLQRVEGALKISVKNDGVRTRLDQLRQSGCLKNVFPRFAAYVAGMHHCQCLWRHCRVRLPGKRVLMPPSHASHPLDTRGGALPAQCVMARPFARSRRHAMWVRAPTRNGCRVRRFITITPMWCGILMFIFPPMRASPAWRSVFSGDIMPGSVCIACVCRSGCASTGWCAPRYRCHQIGRHQRCGA